MARCDVRTRGDGGKIGKSGERQFRGTGQCFNVINDTVSMLRGRRYHRVAIGWILETFEKKFIPVGDNKKRFIHVRGKNPRIYQEGIGYLELKDIFERFNRARILIEDTGNMG